MDMDVSRTSSFDPTQPIDQERYDLALAQAREQRGINLSTIRFDPRQHPRDTKGRFREVLEGLKANDIAELPDGTAVRKLPRGGYQIRFVGNKSFTKDKARDLDRTTSLALDESAKSEHPDSIGGETSWSSLEGFERGETYDDWATAILDRAEEKMNISHTETPMLSPHEARFWSPLVQDTGWSIAETGTEGDYDFIDFRSEVAVDEEDDDLGYAQVLRVIEPHSSGAQWEVQLGNAMMVRGENDWEIGDSPEIEEYHMARNRMEARKKAKILMAGGFA